MKSLAALLLCLAAMAGCRAQAGAEEAGAREDADPPAAEAAAARQDDPLWAAGGQDIWGKVAGRADAVLIRSPGGRSQVSARWVEGRTEGQDEPVLLEFSGALGAHAMRLVPGVGAELVWNAAEDAVLLSSSRAGLNGRWDVKLVRRKGAGVEEHDPSGMIRRRFGSPVRCDWPEDANVGAVGWLPNGNMLLAAQIVDHSVCDSYGLFRAYEVTADGRRIVAEYDQIEAKRRFGPMLGFMIRDAEDACLTRPETCTVEYRRQLSRVAGARIARR